MFTAAAIAAGGPARAADAGTAASADGTSSSPVSDWFAHYYDRVHAAQDSQPHWITPIATVTPRLEQEFRWDELWEHRGDGANLTVSDGGKGLELIPTQSNEILINLPPYQERTLKKPASGLNDWQFLVIKQRFASANEDHGNYIVTGFLGFQAPTGIAKYTNHAWVITPTLAAGKGWGRWDIQSTLGVQLPTSHEDVIGYAILSNTTLQYHWSKYLWPEVEANVTHWSGGQRDGKTQVFLTPGVVLGRFQVTRLTKLIVGVGYQTALSPSMTTKPVVTPAYRQAFILTTRLTF